MGLSLIYEPIQDTIDVVAGATNTTYNPNIDQVSGATKINGGDDSDDEYDDD